MLVTHVTDILEIKDDMAACPVHRDGQLSACTSDEKEEFRKHLYALCAGEEAEAFFRILEKGLEACRKRLSEAELCAKSCTLERGSIFAPLVWNKLGKVKHLQEENRRLYQKCVRGFQPLGLER